MSRRLLKVYYRDENGVFRAIEGLQYGSSLLFILAKVYTLEDEDEDFYVFKKVVS